MNADEVKVTIEHEVQVLTEHRDDIEKILVVPAAATFECLGEEDKRLWIVGMKEEYCITFDEASGRYGLAFRNIMGSMVYLGDDGGIADAYDMLITREEDSGKQGKTAKP
jgi:hypothetical protein